MVNSGPFNGTKVNTEKGRKNPGISAVIDWLEQTGHRQGVGQLSLSRLADQPPALLGRADPDDLLRDAWLESRARRSTAVLLPEDVEWKPTGEVAVETASDLEEHDLPGLRRTCHARDRYDGHVHVLVVVSPALSVAEV